MKKLFSKLGVLFFDSLSIPVAWTLAYWLRDNMSIFPNGLTLPYSLSAFFILMFAQLACYYHFKVYRGLWRFSSLNDINRIIRAVLTAVVIAALIFYLIPRQLPVPRSVLPLYAIILTAILAGARLFLRSQWDRQAISLLKSDMQRVLIVGAGRAGESLIRDLKRTPEYQPVGLIDDNKNQLGLDVHGVRVVGQVSDLPRLVEELDAQLIFIAIPSATSLEMRRIVQSCEKCQIPFHTLPSLQALASGRVEVNALRTVNIEDLLGRDQVQLTWDDIHTNIVGKRILITGGGGSIGSELCRQVLALNPDRVLVLDNNEFNLYTIEQELMAHFPHIPIEYSLNSVTDRIAINNIFQTFKPNIVFHAAAYKHVPLLEGHVRVAVQNNVLGTQIVAEASVISNVEKFILISTDKAVNPSNLMGTTKRVAEIYCQNLNARVNTQFITVRFGNVLDSVGSVVPLFRKQLEQGGPLTVTHPDIERYFMTIPEASQLILQAMANGSGGEIFVLDMGEPIKISYLAQQMIRLAGKEPGKDIEIKYTGLRPGEKLFEELFHSSEQLTETEHKKLFKAQFRQMDWEELIQTFRMLQKAAEACHHEELKILLKSLVPEFHSEMNVSIKVT